MAPAQPTAVTGLRRCGTTRYDIAEALPSGADPAPCAKPGAKSGATWWPTEFAPATVSRDQVRGVVREGPAENDAERIR